MYQYLVASKPFIASIFIGIIITLLFSWETPSSDSNILEGTGASSPYCNE